MTKFYFQKILQKDGWKNKVRISIDKEGLISEIIEYYNGNDYQINIPLAIPRLIIPKNIYLRNCKKMR